jgi:hypothetical protein
LATLDFLVSLFLIPSTLPYLTGLFSGAAVDRVPVMRIFGATPAGQKVCLHLHTVCTPFILPSPCTCFSTPETQAFPYFFLPLDDDLGLKTIEQGEASQPFQSFAISY